MQLINPNSKIDFLGKRKFALALSSLMIIISLLALVPTLRGLNFGIDFTGGTLVEVKFKQAPQIADVRKAIEPAGYGQAIIQEFGSPEEIVIRAQNKVSDASSKISTEILQALKTSFGDGDIDMRRV